MQFLSRSNPVFPPSPDWSKGVFLGRLVKARSRRSVRRNPSPVVRGWRHFLVKRRRHYNRLVSALPPSNAGVEYPARSPMVGMTLWGSVVAAHREGRTVGAFFHGDTPIVSSFMGWTPTSVPCWFRGRHPQWNPRRVSQVTVHPTGLSTWVSGSRPTQRSYLPVRYRRRRSWTTPLGGLPRPVARRQRRATAGCHRVTGTGFSVRTVWIPRETWYAVPARDFEIIRVYTRRWRMQICYPDFEPTYQRVPNGHRVAPPRRWRSAPVVPGGGPIPTSWYGYLRATRRYQRWEKRRPARWGVQFPTPPRVGPIWAGPNPPLVSPRVWTRLCQEYTPVAMPNRRRPRWWWRRPVRLGHAGWNQHACWATRGVPKWYRRVAQQGGTPARWVHRWNTQVRYTLAVGLGLARSGFIRPTRWALTGPVSRQTRRVTREVGRIQLSLLGGPELPGLQLPEWVGPPEWAHPERANVSSWCTISANPSWGIAPPKWIQYQTQMNQPVRTSLVLGTKDLFRKYDHQRVTTRGWVMGDRRRGPGDPRPFIGGFSNVVRLRRALLDAVVKSLYRVTPPAWGNSSWEEEADRVEQTVWEYQEIRPVPRVQPPKPRPTGAWWRTYMPNSSRRLWDQRRRPWIPWEIYRKVMNPPRCWKVYASAALDRWVLQWNKPLANPRRPRRWWLPKPHFKWRLKISPRRYYLAIRGEHPLGRTRRPNGKYNRVHGFTIRYRFMPLAYRRRRLRLRQMWTTYRKLRVRHHPSALSIKQFLYRRSRGSHRRRRRPGHRRLRLTPFERRHLGRRPRVGQWLRLRSVPTVPAWSTRLWGLFIRRGRKAKVETLARQLRSNGVRPWRLYTSGWSHLGTRTRRRGGATIKVPAVVTPSKAAATVRRWIARTVAARTDRDWAVRVGNGLDPTGVMKLRDRHNDDALVHVALL